MITKLQLCEITEVNGAACVCTQAPKEIIIANNIDIQDICYAYCCDTNEPAIKWELFNKPDEQWVKSGQGVCTKTKKKQDLSIPIISGTISTIAGITILSL